MNTPSNSADKELLEVLGRVLLLDDGDTPYWWKGKPAEVLEEVQRVYYKAKGWNP